MTSITRRLFLSLAASLVPASAIAHHGWGGYDTSKSFTVTGKILKSTFENPHCEIEMEVDGKHWHFVLAPPSRMQVHGVMLKAGAAKPPARPKPRRWSRLYCGSVRSAPAA